MKTINKFFIVLIILLMVGLGTVSATNDTVSSNSTVSTAGISTNDVSTSTSYNDGNTSNIQSGINNLSEKTVTKNSSTNKLSASVINVNSSNYGAYFRFNESENITKTTNFVSAGDTINLVGTFNNVNFTVDKANLTITSIGKSARLNNCTVNVKGVAASGSKITNLTIRNSNLYGTGIYLNVSKNITVANNSAIVNGVYAFAFAADKLNNSLIEQNYFETQQSDPTVKRTHSVSVFGSSYYNTIRNNTAVSEGSNGIYFSVYGSGLFQGGYSDNNYVIGNNVSGGNTSWSYTIQIMGKNNLIANNTVSGGYRGISTQDFTNNTITGNQVNATAIGIYACEGALVLNNTVRTNGTTSGVEVGGPGTQVINNTIITGNGSGVVISASRVNVTGNNIITIGGYGIYSKGYYQDIIISSNNMTTGKTGILFKKQSSSKRPNYITITKNIITASTSDYAIDLYEAGAKDPSDAVITVDDSNVLGSARGIGLENAYLKPENTTGTDTPDSNKTYTVTNANYNTYFDTDGMLKTSKVLKGDTLILNGTFYNKDFILPVKVKINGTKAVLYNTTFRFEGDADSSSINNVTIINPYVKGLEESRHAIEVKEVNNCRITNVNITNYDEWESFGILLYSSSGNTISNNTIFTSGDYVNYGIFVFASDLNTITRNNVTLNQTNVTYEYADEIMFSDEIGTIKEVLQNYGIILMYSSTNTIQYNNVKSTALFKSYEFPDADTKNSIVGIDIYYDSQNNKVLNNNISINGYGPFNYGMGVLGAPWGSSIQSLNATGNTFQNNKVTVEGGYFATGFIAGLNSLNTTVINNTFTVSARHNSTQKGDYAYGLTLESSKNTTVRNNTFKLSGASVYGMEVFDSSNNTITDNVLTANATYPYGIVGYRASDNKILRNNITTWVYNYGTVDSSRHSEAIPLGNQSISLVTNSFRNNITNNKIRTNASETVYLSVQAINNTVKENSLQSKSKIGDAAVTSQHSSNKVSNNFLYFTNLTVSPASAKVGGKISLKAVITTEATNLNNLTVTFKLGSSIIGSTKFVNKTATMNYTIPSTWRATTYDIRVNISGTNFQNTTSTAKANITKDPVNTTVTVTRVLSTSGKTVQINATVQDINSNYIEGTIVFKINGTKIGQVSAKLGRASINYTIPTSYAGKQYTILAWFLASSDYKESTGTNILGVQNQVSITYSNISAKLGNKVTFLAKFTVNGKALTSGTVVIKLNDRTKVTTKVVNGYANVSYFLNPTDYGVYRYKLTYVLGQTYTTVAVRQNAILTITNAFTPRFLYNTTSVKVGNKVTLKVRVANSTLGHYAMSGNLGIKINGITLKTNGKPIVYKVVNGTAIFTFNATNSLLGYTNLTFTYSGNSQFASGRATFTRGLYIHS